MNTSKRTRLFAAGAAALALSACFACAQIEGTIYLKGSGKSHQGTIRWQAAGERYTITTADGNSISLSSSQVLRVKVAVPRGLEAAARAVRAGEYQKAIPVLEPLVAQYKMLNWDVVAARYLAEAYLGLDENAKAAAILKQIAAEQPAKAVEQEFAELLWDALLKTGANDELNAALGMVIEGGDRTMAAKAQLKRGDMQQLKGNTREALLNGYLRTVTLFRDVESVQPEALHKAMRAFQEQGQHSYADKMRKKLLAEFPDSPYTAQLKSES